LNLITTTNHESLESTQGKRGVYSPQAAGFTELREEYLETQIFPQPSNGLQLTHNQSISKGLASLVGQLSKILLNFY
jgi:hypothetical protein